MNLLRERHESLRQRVPTWEHATSETDIGYTVRVNEMKAFDVGMKLLHDVNVCKFPSSRQFKDLVRSVKKKSNLLRYVNMIALDPGKPEDVVELEEPSTDQEHCQENDQRIETETTKEHQDDCEASKHLVVRPATTDPVTDLMNQQQSTHECRLKFRALGKDRITTLFTRKGRSSSAILPENVLWQLFSRLNIQKPLFQTIFNELCLVDHDTSDDDSGTVELVDFLDWCWSDEAKVGAEVEESKRPTVAHSHLPSKILNAFDDVVASVVLSLQEAGSSLKITFDTFDSNENGGLELEEFIELLDVLDIGEEEGHADVLTMEDKRTMFELFRPENNMITFDCFERVLKDVSTVWIEKHTLLERRYLVENL